MMVLKPPHNASPVSTNLPSHRDHHLARSAAIVAMKRRRCRASTSSTSAPSPSLEAHPPPLADTIPLRPRTTMELARVGFYRVADRLFVGMRPDRIRFIDLHRLGVKHVISLEDRWSLFPGAGILRRERAHADNARISFLHMPLSPFWPLSFPKVARVLQHMCDESKHPIYVHCYFGQERALFLAGLLRVYCDNWTPERAYEEMRAHGFRPWLVPIMTAQYWRWSRSEKKRAMFAKDIRHD